MSDDDIEGFLEAFVRLHDRAAARAILLDMRESRHQEAYEAGWSDREVAG